MKVIDLLNKIANGEEVPKKIKKTWVYEWSFDEVRDDFSYITKEGCRFDSDWLVLDMLDDEVEIIEEDKKMEKLVIGKDDVAWCEGNMKTDEEMVDIVLEIKDKINKIIDKLNEGE